MFIYKNVEQITRGAFGSVFKGYQYEQDSQTPIQKVALKYILPRPPTSRNLFVGSLPNREIGILYSMNHKNIIDIIDCFYDDTSTPGENGKNITNSKSSDINLHRQQIGDTEKKKGLQTSQCNNISGKITSNGVIGLSIRDNDSNSYEFSNIESMINLNRNEQLLANQSMSLDNNSEFSNLDSNDQDLNSLEGSIGLVSDEENDINGYGIYTNTSEYQKTTNHSCNSKNGSSIKKKLKIENNNTNIDDVIENSNKQLQIRKNNEYLSQNKNQTTNSIMNISINKTNENVKILKTIALEQQFPPELQCITGSRRHIQQFLLKTMTTEQAKPLPTTIVMPFIPYTLYNLIYPPRNACVRKMPENVIKTIAQQILRGLSYIHSVKHIIHRDIKPGNILVNQNGIVKIADFGQATFYNEITVESPKKKQISQNYDNYYYNNSEIIDNSTGSSEKKTLTGNMGTKIFRAPEAALSGSYNYGVDIFAFGCIVFEMLTQRPLFTDDSELAHISALNRIIGPLAKIPILLETQDLDKIVLPQDFELMSGLEKILDEEGIGKDSQAAKFLKTCLNGDPTKRIMAEDAIGHPWFYEYPKPITIDYLSKYIKETITIKN